MLGASTMDGLKMSDAIPSHVSTPACAESDADFRQTPRFEGALSQKRDSIELTLPTLHPQARSISAQWKYWSASAESAHAGGHELAQSAVAFLQGEKAIQL